jgi:epsilon-lactone hydrolase
LEFKRIKSMKPIRFVLHGGVFLCCYGLNTYVHAQSTTTSSLSSSLEKAGTVHIPAYDLPLSIYMSEEAKRAYIELNKLASETRAAGDRKEIEYMERLELAARAAYPVIIEHRIIGGVRTELITPKQGVSERNRSRVLINLHGGGFNTPISEKNELIESIPVAAVGRITVISIDYRQAPEYKFPAASEDVAAVYKDLLGRYRPQSIGIYGCSAGGVLTAESIAWFQKENLPVPGAIGIFCAGADHLHGGDSAYYAMPFLGGRPAPLHPNPIGPEDYFSNADPRDPLVSPVLYRSVLSKFPATLVITGTRDFRLSPAVYTYSRLVREGVDTELHVWEGMWHAFLYSVDTPESKEAFDITAKFFDAHLDRGS